MKEKRVATAKTKTTVHRVFLSALETCDRVLELVQATLPRISSVVQGARAVEERIAATTTDVPDTDARGDSPGIAFAAR